MFNCFGSRVQFLVVSQCSTTYSVTFAKLTFCPWFSIVKNGNTDTHRANDQSKVDN